MSRYRLMPTAAQAAALLEHCRHARFVWNLALEQWLMWRPGSRSAAPEFAERARQLTEARTQYDWLRAGPQMVQQQALRDFDQAVQRFFAASHGRPTWRKAAGRAYKAGTFPFLANGRARALGDTTGMVKFLADATTDEILGVHIVGPMASELISEAVVAMEFRASAEDIARICHAHPSLSEATKEAALAVDKRTLNF